MEQKNKVTLGTVLFSILSILWLAPIAIVLINSFKRKAYISRQPFHIPTGKAFVKLENYFNGMKKIGFFQSFGYSLWITVASVLLIILCTSMFAWYITRVKNTRTTALYYLCAFSMIVPFQMVMFTLSKLADMMHLGNPLEIFFQVVMPVLKPTCISTAILQTMWIWNDYLLPYLVLDITKYKTIPIAIQYLKGGYGSVDMGAMMAMLVLAIIPIVIFYMFCQKYIIEGVVAGAVKG